jgi:hypothetical protein
VNLTAILAVAAMGTSPVPQERLADVSCDRLAEYLTALHEDSVAFEQEVGEPLPWLLGPDPGRDRRDAMTRRMRAVARYMAARNLRPRMTENDGVLDRSTEAQLMTEFERRCGV